MPNARTKKIKWARKPLIGITVLCAAIFIATILQLKHIHTVDPGDKVKVQNATSSQNMEVISVTLANVPLRAQVARTPQQKSRGLCCRDSLVGNAAMLFVYDTPGEYRFWMKDTRIPLDMYWIDSEHKIVHIEENVRPESYPKTFSSKNPAQYVLETNAGFAKQHNIVAGELVEFSLR